MGLERGRLMTLEALLQDIADLRWPSDQLYIEGPRSTWAPQTRCAVVEVDPYEEEPPTFTVGDVQLNWALAGFDVVDVCHNLHAASPSAERFVAAPILP